MEQAWLADTRFNIINKTLSLLVMPTLKEECGWHLRCVTTWPEEHLLVSTKPCILLVHLPKKIQCEEPLTLAKEMFFSAALTYL